MTKKEKAIQKAQSNIDYWQRVKSQIEQLPDEIVDVLAGDEAALETVVKVKKETTPEEGEKEYGRNIGLIRTMLKENPNGLRKSDILNQFPDAILYSETELYNVVTNAISYLNQNGYLEKYKPRDVKMKGYYWKLKPGK